MIEQISTLVELLDLLSLDHRIILREGDQPIQRLKSLQQAGLAGENDDLLVAMSKLEPSELYRVFAAISLRPELLTPNQINRLHELLLDDSSVSLQTAIARQLRLATHPSAINKLFDGIIRCPDPQLRSSMAYAIAENKSSDWQAKYHQMQLVLQKRKYHREHLDYTALITAIRPPANDLFQNRFLLTDYLIKQVNNLTNDVERLAGILAGLIVESVGQNLNRANQRVGEYEKDNDEPSTSLALLRSELNSLLTPTERQAHLEEMFTAPLREAHDEIRSIWESSIRNVERTVRSRRWISVLGITISLIILLSAVPIIVLEMQAGLLVALIGVLILVSTVVFGGPVRDLKQVLTEIGASNTVYTAYIQRMLEISTAFKHLYLHNQISQENLAVSNDLISKAMNDTVKALRAEGKTTLDDFLTKLGN